MIAPSFWVLTGAIALGVGAVRVTEELGHRLYVQAQRWHLRRVFAATGHCGACCRRPLEPGDRCLICDRYAPDGRQDRA